MAITNTRTVQRIEVYPASDPDATGTVNVANPTLMVVYEHVFDDSTDDELPVTTSKTKYLSRYSDESAGTATDVSGDDQLVQDICGELWS